jgi:PAS domain S-box-containing protein
MTSAPPPAVAPATGPAATGPGTTSPAVWAAGVASLLDAVPDAFVAVDADGSLMAWNAAATALLGWSAADLLGRPVHQALFPDRDPAAIHAAIAALAAAGPDSRSGPRRRVLITARDGRQVPVEAMISVLPGPGGIRIAATLRDLQAASGVGQQPREGFLGALLDSLDAAVFACDAQGRTVFSNPALRRLLDLPGDLPADAVTIAGDLLVDTDGRPLASALHPSSRVLAGEEVRDVELLLARPGRPTRRLLAHAEPITVEDQVLGAVVALHEITEARRTQWFRECELAVTRVLVDAADTAHAAQEVIEAVATCLGWPHAELWLVDEVGDRLRPAACWTDGDFDCEGVLSPHLRRGVGLAGTVWSTGAAVWVPDVATETRFVATGAARRGLRTALAVPVSSAATVVGVLALYADTVDDDEEALTGHLAGIAARLGQYLERRRAEELSLQLARTKDDFLALVGHELRTPLTSIVTYTQLLADSPECWATEGQQLIGVIARNTESLAAIVEDLLDLAGLESGHITIRPADTDLAVLTREAVDTVRAAAEARGLRLSAELPASAPIRGDPQRLRQMMDNLLSNAVKYSREGGTIRVELSQLDGVATLTVSDTGIGVPPDERAQLFQRFFRASTARDNGIPGTGLGLVVTRLIVECHGGQVTAGHDEPGTTMTVRLPLAGV